MRQKDVDQLAEIWAKDIEHADPVELPGFEFAIGALVKPLAYNADRYHPLDMSGLLALIDRCKAGQRPRLTGVQGLPRRRLTPKTAAPLRPCQAEGRCAAPSSVTDVCAELDDLSARRALPPPN